METVNQIGLLFFIAQNQEGRARKNEKHRRKNFNGRRRNQAVTKQKKKAHQSAETGRKKKEG